MSRKDFNRNPKGANQWKLRADSELQAIINSKPRNWTKKDFRGEGKCPRGENTRRYIQE